MKRPHRSLSERARLNRLRIETRCIGCDGPSVTLYCDSCVQPIVEAFGDHGGDGVKRKDRRWNGQVM